MSVVASEIFDGLSNVVVRGVTTNSFPPFPPLPAMLALLSDAFPPKPSIPIVLLSCLNGYNYRARLTFEGRRNIERNAGNWHVSDWCLRNDTRCSLQIERYR